MSNPLPANDPGIADDQTLPFFLQKATVRGRIVRLGPSFNEIVTRHAYPEPVAALLGEALAVAAALAGALKFEGVFTLQAKSDGAVRMLVADVTHSGHMRGYAQVDEDKLPTGPVLASERVEALMGKGYLAFTVDQGAEMERYQGIVELQPGGLSASVQHYFRQSEQIDTGLKLAAQRTAQGWRAGALLLQRLPEEGGHARTLLDAPDEDESAEADDNAWDHLMALVGTVSDIELTDPQLPSDDLLFRLFHEEEDARVGEPHRLLDRCRCSRGRVARVLLSLPVEDREHLRVDGVVSATCEFCSTRYMFDDADLEKLEAIGEEP
ncbi:MAG: Hsp33 family molecular chaperone HslO [Elstera sp.]